MHGLRLDNEIEATRGTRVTIAGGTIAIVVLMIAGLVNASPGLLTTIPGVVCLALFTVLTAWIAFGFCVAMAGTRQLWKRGVAEAEPAVDHVVDAPADADGQLDGEFVLERVALLVPIYNEDPAAVMACVQATAESLRRTGQGARFDFFILSDTTNPDVWVREEMLWSKVRADMEGASPAIHYRHRVENRGRKAGNIGEFLERWGLDYKYFLILDADSTMDGATLVELARRMDRNNRLGILQAPPLPEGRESLWARAQQFSARAYGPLFNWGLVAWTGGEGNYWGHNAMIRTRAFLRHCGLSELPGPAPLGGEVLSHDFVEAALMLRAGYEVRLAADLEGGFEQCPTTIEDHARRDQRWCQGNMQHLRIAVAPAWRWVSRWHFISGALSYLASPLWLLFLISGVLWHLS
ncbi:MAG: glucans biosynthesis glucosyltransferase MdoH, partial [Planctomycetaceae bacterium]